MSIALEPLNLAPLDSVIHRLENTECDTKRHVTYLVKMNDETSTMDKRAFCLEVCPLVIKL